MMNPNAISFRDFDKIIFPNWNGFILKHKRDMGIDLDYFYQEDTSPSQRTLYLFV